MAPARMCGSQSVSCQSAAIEIRVKATDSSLDDFDIDKVKASVSLKDMSVGSYQIPVTVKLPKGYELLDDVVADVTISEVSNTADNNNE